MKSKQCTKCKETKPVEQFSKNDKSPTGFRCQCKDCDAKYRRENIAYRKQWNRNFRKTNWKYNVYASAKQRAKKKGLEFSITMDDITIPSLCPVLGIPISMGKKSRVDGSPSIDRINNNMGYIRGNILVVSWRANKLKSDSTQEERKRLMDFYQQYEK